MKRHLKKIIMALLICSFIFGLSANKKIGSAKTISERYSVSSTKLAKVAIKNVKANNKVTVTFSAYPDSPSNVSRVEIYKNRGFTGTAVLTKTFNSANKYEATFSLPAGKTYYAKISSATGNSFSGTFVATY